MICLAYLIFQDGIGVPTAMGLDLHPLVGLLSGSITLSGGHGTGVAYVQRFSDVNNLAGAMACATYGLVLGGLIGGPVAGRLIRKHGLRPATPTGRGPVGEEPQGGADR
jgi:ESS family glutamate:Na+ symporter